MAKGINIAVASETQAFEAGIKTGVLAPLEDVVDATDDAARAGDAAGKDLGRAFDDAGGKAKDLGKDAERAGEDIEDALREAQRETSDLQTEYKSLGDTIKRESRDAARDMKRNMRDGTDGAKEGLNDFKQESASTAKETAASFDGSAESITQAFQEVAANAFVGFGPAGLVAGLAAAAGIGLVISAFDTAGQKSEEMAEQANTAYDRMIEAGGRFLSSEVQNAAIQDVIKEKWKEIKEITELTGLSAGEVARGYALGGTELEAVKDKLNAAYDANNELIMGGTGFTETLQEQNGKIANQVEALNGVVGVQAQALEMAKAYDAATGGAVAQRSAERDAIQDRNRALENTPKTVIAKLTVDDSALKAALVRKQIDVVFNAVDKFGRSIK